MKGCSALMFTRSKFFFRCTLQKLSTYTTLPRIGKLRPQLLTPHWLEQARGIRKICYTTILCKPVGRFSFVIEWTWSKKMLWAGLDWMVPSRIWELCRHERRAVQHLCLPGPNSFSAPHFKSYFYNFAKNWWITSSIIDTPLARTGRAMYEIWRI